MKFISVVFLSIFGLSFIDAYANGSMADPATTVVFTGIGDNAVQVVSTKTVTSNKKNGYLIVIEDELEKTVKKPKEGPEKLLKTVHRVTESSFVPDDGDEPIVGDNLGGITEKIDVVSYKEDGSPGETQHTIRQVTYNLMKGLPSFDVEIDVYFYASEDSTGRITTVDFSVDSETKRLLSLAIIAPALQVSWYYPRPFPFRYMMSAMYYMQAARPTSSISLAGIRFF